MYDKTYKRYTISVEKQEETEALVRQFYINAVRKKREAEENR